MVPGDHLNAFTRATTATTQFLSGSTLRIVSAASGAPRHHHYQNGRRGLLVESASTNLLLRSADPANASWTKTNVTVDATLPVMAPDGTLVARVVETAAAGFHHLSQSVTIPDGAPVAASGYFRTRERFRGEIAVTGGGGFFFAAFRVDTGVITSSGGGSGGSLVRAYLDDDFAALGWYRVVVVGTLAGGVTTATAEFRLLDDSGNNSYTGDTSKSAYWWGLQAEASVFVGSSYIPTLGSTVTRNLESANIVMPFGPQPMWVYHRFIELGTAFTPSARAWQWGTSAAPTANLKRAGSNLYGVEMNNGVVGTDVDLGVGPAMFDEVEILVQFNDQGRPDIYQSLNRGAVSAVVGSGTNIGWPTAMGSNLIWIGSDNGATVGYASHERLCVGRGSLGTEANRVMSKARGIAG